MNPKEHARIEIRMSFTGRLAERLEDITDYYQVESYEDSIRFIVTQTDKYGQGCTKNPSQPALGKRKTTM
jgi:hypothetical protein